MTIDANKMRAGDIWREELKKMIQAADVWAAAFSPDGSKIVTGSVDGQIPLTDLNHLSPDNLWSDMATTLDRRISVQMVGTF